MDPVVSKEKTISTVLPLPPASPAALESLAGGDSTLTFLTGEGFSSSLLLLPLPLHMKLIRITNWRSVPPIATSDMKLLRTTNKRSIPLLLLLHKLPYGNLSIVSN